MSKLLVIYACAVLGNAPVTEPQESVVPLIQTNTEMTQTLSSQLVAFNDNDRNFKTITLIERESEKFDLNTIAFVEEEEEIDLGFDTSKYLPEGFDPYKTYFDVDAVVYNDADNSELGFDTAEYLPVNFDAYTNVIPVESVNFVEDDQIDLGFDPKDYLPEGFDPYEAYVDLAAIEFIEEEDMELGFDTSKYLPEGFDPYSDAINVDAINYVELDDLDF